MALAAAVVFVGVAALPPIGVDQSTGFVREPTLEIGLTSLFEQSQGRAAGSAMMFETADAHLEETDATVRKNIALIVLESTRATATSIYDGDHQTTPYLKSLAESSVVMDDAYAVMPHTSKALVAILCGIPPRPTMRIVEAVPGNIPGQCLPQLLAEQGYRSVFWQAATAGFEHRTKLISRLGFDDFYPIESLDTNGFKKVNYFGYEDDVMVEPSRRWLKKHADKPFLATYMTLTTHHDYGAPPRYGHVDYANGEMFNRYLNAVHYLDNFVHNIIRQYKQLGLYDSTIFVVLGDHGRGLASMGANNTTTSSIKKGSMCRGLSTRPGVRRSRLPSSGPSISSTWCPR